MRILYFIKWPLIIFLTGLVARTFAVMMKIMHWPYADLVLWISTLFMVSGALFMIVKLFLLKKTDKAETNRK